MEAATNCPSFEALNNLPRVLCGQLLTLASTKVPPSRPGTGIQNYQSRQHKSRMQRETQAGTKLYMANATFFSHYVFRCFVIIFSFSSFISLMSLSFSCLLYSFFFFLHLFFPFHNSFPFFLPFFVYFILIFLSLISIHIIFFLPLTYSCFCFKFYFILFLFSFLILSSL